MGASTVGWYHPGAVLGSPSAARYNPSPPRTVHAGPAAPLILGPGSPMQAGSGGMLRSSSGHNMMMAGGPMPQGGASSMRQMASHTSRPSQQAMLTAMPPGFFTASGSGMAAAAAHSGSSASNAAAAAASALPSDTQAAMLYNATTREVILADLRMLRELQRQGHVLVGVDEAYRSQIAAVQALVNGPLMGKREALMAQHARLSARLSEVTATRAALEREVAVLAEEMVGRLRSAESLKLALLAREQAEIERDLDALQALVSEVSGVSASGMVPFLNAAAPLLDACGRLVAKPFTAEVDVAADDLPAEARAFRELSDAHGALAKLLSVKDSMISHLLAERSALQGELATLSGKYASEVEVLDRQAQDYYDQLQALQAAAPSGQARSQSQSPER